MQVLNNACLVQKPFRRHGGPPLRALPSMNQWRTTRPRSCSFRASSLMETMLRSRSRRRRHTARCPLSTKTPAPSPIRRRTAMQVPTTSRSGQEIQTVGRTWPTQRSMSRPVRRPRPNRCARYGPKLSLRSRQSGNASLAHRCSSSSHSPIRHVSRWRRCRSTTGRRLVRRGSGVTRSVTFHPVPHRRFALRITLSLLDGRHLSTTRWYPACKAWPRR